MYGLVNQAVEDLAVRLGGDQLWVEVATRSSDRLIRLINDILDVERMAAGMLAIVPRCTSSRDLLESAAAEMSGLAEASGIGIHIAATEEQVWADPDRVVQALSNLLSNALKFSTAGDSVELRSTVMENHVRFDVRDTGQGIPPDQLRRIFQPFHQGDASDTRQHGGSGLGLAISRGLVEGQGGRIWVTSRVGEETTASFTLPRAAGRVR